MSANAQAFLQGELSHRKHGGARTFSERFNISMATFQGRNEGRYEREGLGALEKRLRNDILAVQRLRETGPASEADKEYFVPKRLPFPSTPPMPSGTNSPRASAHHRHTSSNLSSGIQTPSSPHLYTRYDQPSVHPTSTHTPNHQRYHASLLHHSRSSPELETTFKNPAKLIWPDNHLGGPAQSR